MTTFFKFCHCRTAGKVCLTDENLIFVCNLKPQPLFCATVAFSIISKVKGNRFCFLSASIKVVCQNSPLWKVNPFFCCTFKSHTSLSSCDRKVPIGWLSVALVWETCPFILVRRQAWKKRKLYKNVINCSP